MTQDTEELTRTICPVEISRFEVTGSSDLKIHHDPLSVTKKLWT